MLPLRLSAPFDCMQPLGEPLFTNPARVAAMPGQQGPVAPSLGGGAAARLAAEVFPGDHPVQITMSPFHGPFDVSALAGIAPGARIDFVSIAP